MDMKTLTLKIPDSLDELEVKMQFASFLFEKGILSSGQAAEFAGVSKKFFLENTGKYGTTVFNETVEDLDKLIHE
jgi:predicted HTH domain antitoxin